jgi:choline dehydrogenase-like flavoprotein
LPVDLIERHHVLLRLCLVLERRTRLFGLVLDAVHGPVQHGQPVSKRLAQLARGLLPLEHAPVLFHQRRKEAKQRVARLQERKLGVVPLAIGQRADKVAAADRREPRGQLERFERLGAHHRLGRVLERELERRRRALALLA